MCFFAGQGSFGWHFTIVVSVFLPIRKSIQCFPFHTGVKISVTTVTTVKPRVAALCIAADPPAQFGGVHSVGESGGVPTECSVIGVPSCGADSYCEGTSPI
jgi:hypothetical protein